MAETTTAGDARAGGRIAAWQLFDWAVAAAGFAFIVIGLTRVQRIDVAVVLATLMTAMLARFPVRLGRSAGGAEIGLDAAVLVFLLNVTPGWEAAGLWSLGQALGQVLARKSREAAVFNIGVAGWCAMAATLVGGALGIDATVSPLHDVGAALAVAAAAFGIDYLLTAISLRLFSGRFESTDLRDGSTALSLGGFLVLGSTGLLAGSVYRHQPGWYLTLLCGPLVAVAAASWAVTRSKQQAVVLETLLATAERGAGVTDAEEIAALLVRQTSVMFGTPHVVVRDTPPDRGEIGAGVPFLDGDRWLVAARRVVGGRYSDGDHKALDGLLRVATNAAQRAQIVHRMEWEALHDPLTRLGNRALLGRRLTELADARAPHVSLLMIDLDGFKEINDSLGHRVGDDLLVVMADRLRSCVRAPDTPVRVGGDEFAVVVVGDEIAAVAAATRLIESIRQPVDLAGATLTVSSSVGVAGRGDETVEELLRNADLAMYQAKRHRRDSYRIFEPSMLQEMLDRVIIEADLRNAVAHPEQLVLHYQPVVDLDNGEVVGAEALLRWNHPTRGLVPPLDFIPVAEECGLIHPIGRWVLMQAYSDALQWATTYQRPLMLMVNVSPRQLEDPEFIRHVTDVVRTRQPHVQLVLEITESALVDASVVQSLEQLRAAGVRLSVDDFGTGYSALSYLRRLPVDHLKIDRSFVNDVADDERAASVVAAIRGVAGSLGLDVVAEGVETAQQAKRLIAMGCPFGQGWLYGRPVEAERFAGVLAHSVSTVLASGHAD